MGFSIRDLAADRRPTDVPIGAQTVHVVYKPMAYTPPLSRKISTIPVWEFLVEILDSWDITDDAGAPIPIEIDAMDVVPLQVLQEIASKILEEVRSPMSGEASGSSEGS